MLAAIWITVGRDKARKERIIKKEKKNLKLAQNFDFTAHKLVEQKQGRVYYTRLYIRGY